MSTIEIPTYVPALPLPAPLTSGSGVQSYTDPYGDVWVAANGVFNGAWKRARDVLHAHLYRNAAYTPNTSEAFLSFDSGRDLYGMYSAASSGWIAPIAGYYRVEMQIAVNGTATGQSLTALIRKSDGTLLGAGGGWATGVGNLSAVAVYEDMFDPALVLAGTKDAMTKMSASASLTGITSWAWNRLNIDYLGTG
jgi:hypothetical protein